MALKINSFITNPNVLFLLVLFNGAMVMNFDFIIWEHPLFLIAVCFFALNLINYRFWWTTLLILPVSFYQIAYSFPRTANHCNLLLFIELFILGAITYKFLHPKFAFSKAFIQQMFRVVLVATYFYAGFNKLNADFFNPCVSCVNFFHNLFMANFTGEEYTTSKYISILFQYFTMAVELIVPFGIFFSRTRIWTAIILLGFHFYLTFISFFHFSALMTFLILGSIMPLDKEELQSNILKGLKYYLSIGLLVLVLNSVFKTLDVNHSNARFIIGIVFNLGLLSLLIPFFKAYKSNHTDSLTFKEISGLALTVIFLSFWSLKSYIGLGNSGNLTMFSNLITEQSKSNHYLIDTKKTKIFLWEEDYIQIIKLHDSLKNQDLEGYNLPVTEFKHLTHTWTEKVNYPLNAVLVYNNETLRISDLKNSIFNQYEWWYRYVPFRKTQPQGNQPCLW